MYVCMYVEHIEHFDALKTKKYSSLHTCIYVYGKRTFYDTRESCDDFLLKLCLISLYAAIVNQSCLRAHIHTHIYLISCRCA